MNCDSNKPDIKLPVKWPNDIFYLMGLRRSCFIEIQKMYIQIISRILKRFGNRNIVISYKNLKFTKSHQNWIELHKSVIESILKRVSLIM